MPNFPSLNVDALWSSSINCFLENLARARLSKSFGKSNCGSRPKKIRMSSLPAIAQAIGPHCVDASVMYDPETKLYRAHGIVDLGERAARVLGEWRTTPALTMADFEKDILAGHVRVDSFVLHPTKVASRRR